MHQNEIPLGQRTRLYRFFEMLPALLSWGMVAMIIVLSVIDLMLGAFVIVLFVVVSLYRVVRGGVDSVRGFRRLKSAESIDWTALNAELERHIERGRVGGDTGGQATGLPSPFQGRHARLLTEIAEAPGDYPKPSELVHAVVVAAYNEPYEVVQASLHSLTESSIGSENLVVVFAHEERGGDAMRETVARLTRTFGHRFRAFLPVEHPAGLPDEIQGKGGNITFAGEFLQRWVEEQGIDPDAVIVLTLDCDNRVHPSYFDCVTYEFVRARDRQRVSFQPISLFVNNVWHAPAPSRVIAAGNSLWNLISTVRPYSLRNFASHSQPLGALIDMGFWSRRTIVEDGHQYWRSFFHFHGEYAIVPIHVPITQDAVLADTLPRTLKAQFSQLSRWSYGASDIPYVGVRTFTRDRPAPFGKSLRRFLILLDSHVSWSTVAPILAFGAWLPFVISRFGTLRWQESPVVEWLNHIGVPNWIAEFTDFRIGSSLGWASFSVTHRFPYGTARNLAEALPDIVGTVQRYALIGVLITMLLTLIMIPKRPEGVSRFRSFSMLAQWILLPVTMLCYNTLSAVGSQFRLLIGKYRESFVVTEKAALPARAADRESELAR